MRRSAAAAPRTRAAGRSRDRSRRRGTRRHSSSAPCSTIRVETRRYTIVKMRYFRFDEQPDAASGGRTGGAGVAVPGRQGRGRWRENLPGALDPHRVVAVDAGEVSRHRRGPDRRAARSRSPAAMQCLGTGANLGRRSSGISARPSVRRREIEPGAADDDRPQAERARLGERCGDVAQPGAGRIAQSRSRHGRRAGAARARDRVVRGARRQHAPAGIDLAGVGIDDARRRRARPGQRQRRLAAGGRAGDQDRAHAGRDPSHFCNIIFVMGRVKPRPRRTADRPAGNTVDASGKSPCNAPGS